MASKAKRPDSSHRSQIEAQRSLGSPSCVATWAVVETDEPLALRLTPRGTVTLKIFGEPGHGAQQVDAYTDENTMVVDFFDAHLRPLANE